MMKRLFGRRIENAATMQPGESFVTWHKNQTLAHTGYWLHPRRENPGAGCL